MTETNKSFIGVNISDDVSRSSSPTLRLDAMTNGSDREQPAHATEERQYFSSPTWDYVYIAFKDQFDQIARIHKRRNEIIRQKENKVIQSALDLPPKYRLDEIQGPWPFPHLSEWFDRPYRFTLATESVDPAKMLFAIKYDSMKWDSIQPRWEAVLKREWSGKQSKLDKTEIARLELAHIGRILAESLQRAKNGIPNPQDDVPLFIRQFRECRFIYKKSLRARGVREDPREETGSKWLRIGMEGAYGNRDINPYQDEIDMFWHDVRWAMRNEFLAKKLSHNDAQKVYKELNHNRQQLIRLKGMYDEAKNSKTVHE